MKICDLHCDTITKANEKNIGLDSTELDISVEDGGYEKYCQCFAIFCPDSFRGNAAYDYYCRNRDFFNNELKRLSGKFFKATGANKLKYLIESGQKAGIMTVEGGAVIAGSLDNLHNIYNDGARMMTLTWNGENEIGCGSSDQKFHLKKFGIDVIKEMEKIGMIIDVSHLSDAGFYDVADTISGTFVVSHSNLRKRCHHVRNLTDEQFKIIIDRKGLVGINFYKNFISENPSEASIDMLCDHIEDMLYMGGENVICLGSDYDGCDVVGGIRKQCEIGNLYNRLIEREIDKNIVDKIFFDNAFSFLTNNLGE